jgi:transcriptional regulator with XRE-family HTH domain
LDEELRFYRQASRQENPTQELLRRVRQVMGIPVAEMARELKVNRSGVFRLEQSEGRGTISLNSMDRVAQAMGCKLVYGIIPIDGKTMGEMAEWRKQGRGRE